MRSLSKIVEQFKQDWTQELSEVKLKAACIDAGYQKEPCRDTQISLTSLSNLLNLAALERLFMFVFRD